MKKIFFVLLLILFSGCKTTRKTAIETTAETVTHVTATQTVDVAKTVSAVENESRIIIEFDTGTLISLRNILQPDKDVPLPIRKITYNVAASETQISENIVAKTEISADENITEHKIEKTKEKKNKSIPLIVLLVSVILALLGAFFLFKRFRL